MKLIPPIPIVDGSPITAPAGRTYYDKNGVLQTAPANTLRVTYDPADLSAAPYPLIVPGVDVLGPNYGLIYSSITENDTDDAPLWNGDPANNGAGNTYTQGQKARRPGTHRVYECLITHNTQNTSADYPENNLAGNTPKWMDYGPTNLYAPFDHEVDTPAQASGSFTYVFRPGQIVTALAIVGAEARDVRVSVVDYDGTLVYRKTKTLRVRNCRSFSDYFFKPVSYKEAEVFDDLPPYYRGLICVTVNKPNSTARAGDIIIGRVEEVGELQTKPKIRTLRYSAIKTDAFGRTKFTKRRSAKLFSGQCFVEADPPSLADEAVRVMDAYTADPVVIVGDAAWSSLIVLGFVQDFELDLDADEGSFFDFQFQGFA
jgi:hypothetical protein